MNANIQIPDDLLQSAIAQSIYNGELAEKISAKVADKLAEITTYNHSEAAKILNISRSTLYEYREADLLTFRADGRISLAALLDFQRNFPEKEIEIIRKTKTEKRRVK